jgi:hypothetical protein
MTNFFPSLSRGPVAPGGPLVLWVVVASAAHVAGLPGLGLSVAAIIAAFALGGSLPRRALTAAAVVPVAALGDLPAFGWIASATFLAAACEFAREGGAGAAARHVLPELDLHIERCRRRGESGHVLVVRDHDPADQPLDLFRLTDSVAVRLVAGAPELRAVIDDASFDRDALELRIRERLGPVAQVGWATFPADGVTLEVLLEHARDAARETVPAATPEVRPAAVYPVARTLTAEPAVD